MAAPYRVDARGEGAEALIGFVVAAALVGVLTGLSAASFRLLLEQVARVRTSLAGWAHGSWWGLIVVVLACTAAATVAAALVHRVEPHAEGSGIPRVEAIAEGHAEARPIPDIARQVHRRFVSHRRRPGPRPRGPSVQMGGTAAVIVATLTQRNRADLRVLVAGGAAAGLATAFSAPIAGGVFVLEELLKRFDPRTTVATLVASASGFAAAHLVVQTQDEFDLAPLADPRLVESGWVFAIAIVTGVLGVLYNQAVMFGLRRADASRWPKESPCRRDRRACRPAGLGRTRPDRQRQQPHPRRTSRSRTLLALTGVLVLRFVLGVVSYAAATPGGLFAPMLVIGSEAGLIVGLIAMHVAPHTAPSLPAAALIGMAAFFTATVHAPVTGLILATEMTSNSNQLSPMLGACAVAMLAAVALRSQPIYDRLTLRAAQNTKRQSTGPSELTAPHKGT